MKQDVLLSIPQGHLLMNIGARNMGLEFDNETGELYLNTDMGAIVISNCVLDENENLVYNDCILSCCGNNSNIIPINYKDIKTIKMVFKNDVWNTYRWEIDEDNLCLLSAYLDGSEAFSDLRFVCYDWLKEKTKTGILDLRCFLDTRLNIIPTKAKPKWLNNINKIIIRKHSLHHLLQWIDKIEWLNPIIMVYDASDLENLKYLEDSEYDSLVLDAKKSDLDVRILFTTFGIDKTGKLIERE